MAVASQPDQKVAVMPCEMFPLIHDVNEMTLPKTKQKSYNIFSAFFHLQKGNR